MSSYTQIIYHIVFATKTRLPCLSDNIRPDFHAYVAGLIRNKKCHPHRMNSVTDHIHILCSLHPTLSLSNLIKDIKIASSIWLKQHATSTPFSGWQDGYGAFTITKSDQPRLVKYIDNQQEHHRKLSYLEEMRMMLKEACVDYDEQYLK